MFNTAVDPTTERMTRRRNEQRWKEIEARIEPKIQAKIKERMAIWWAHAMKKADRAGVTIPDDKARKWREKKLADIEKRVRASFRNSYKLS